MTEHSPTAIVTGGSRGIGRAIVDRLARDGFSVLFTYRQDGAAAAAVEQAHRACGRRVTACKADQSSTHGIDLLFETASELFPRKTGRFLDAMVCSAGTVEHAPFDAVDPQLFDRVMSVNARGTFFTMQRGARAMRDGGRIVCVSSIGTAWPSPGEAIYAASKAAVEQFARVSSRELGARGITVNVVSPGPIDTDTLRKNVDPAQLEGLAQMTALHRLGTPEDVAAIVGFLVTPAAGWITGRNIHADGGLV
ncbi:MAG TPA: SDR family oxidoreductase [Steroidobacter sp.]|uniref:SDR family oxidoreductase n=1 Tax=Steroidobacter sp. TaxID=1978227 RepID=UPI002EDB0E9A